MNSQRRARRGYAPVNILAPRGAGAYLGNLTESPLPWLGNSRKKLFDIIGFDLTCLKS